MPATFDGDNLVITLPSNLGTGLLTIDAKVDLYSDWKEWVLGTPQRQGYPPAFRVSGGDTVDLNTGLRSGAYYFLRNDLGWRIRPFEEHGNITLLDNLVPEDSTKPILIPTIGPFTVLVSGLQPITQIASGGGGGSSVWTETEKNNIIADVNLIESKLPTDGLEIASYQQVADAGLNATQSAQLLAIYNKLPLDGGDIASGADVANIVGAGLSSTQATQLADIFNKLPLTGQISSDLNVLALIGQGLTSQEKADLSAILAKMPLTGVIANQADVSAIAGQGLTTTQATQLQNISNALPVGTISSASDVVALIGQGLSVTEINQLQSIFNKMPAIGPVAAQSDVSEVGLSPTEAAQLQAIYDKLPVGALDKIASDADVAAVDTVWTLQEKQTIMNETNTAMRQATKAVNNTEAAV